jgi:3-oxoadipate enol-lactonase
MAVARINDIEINYRLEGDGGETVVLINGLADDLETWAFQVDELLAAGYRVLRFDNRGIGASSKPAGPYSSRMLADDAKALADALGVTGFHLIGVSMGGMIAQEYALSYPGDLRSATFACTYAAPGPFCSRMFAMWADMAPVLGVPFVMRDVTLWASWPSSRPRCGTWTSRCTRTSPSWRSSSGTIRRAGSARWRCRRWCWPASRTS